MRRRGIFFGIIILFVAISIVALVRFGRMRTYKETIVRLGDSTVTAWVADTDAKREKGLSGTASLAEGQGMLFVFDEPTKSGFWMKEMEYPIDIIWIHATGQVLDLRHAVSPETFPAVFESDAYASYVLEVPGGWASRHGVNVGSISNVE